MLFHQATAVTADPAVEGRLTAEIQPGWSIAGNANGGYLVAVAARAMAERSGRPDPATITTHYLSPAKPGLVSIDVDVVKEGRRFATATASMTSADTGKQILQLVGAFTDLSQASGPELVDAAPPALPPVEECLAPSSAGEAAPEIANKIDCRLHPDDAVFMTGSSGDTRMRGWFRLHDDEPMDSIVLTQVADSFPPAVFNANFPVSWVPTVELTVHVRARPVPGWLRCEFRSRFISGGFLEEDGLMWDESGQLVAQSRQLALLPQPS